MRTHYIDARDIEVGDIVLTTLASNAAVVYADTVRDRYEYDEMTYLNSGDLRFFNEDLVTVLRPT